MNQENKEKDTDTTHNISHDIPQLLTSNVLGISNADVANSIITNTLLNSMKTNNPLIDAIISLVFISKFKNTFLKNMSIVIVLTIGILYHRITKNVDILNVFYEKMAKYYDISVIVQYIPSKYIRNLVLKYNGNLLSVNVSNKQDYIENKQQYNLLTLFHKIVDKYPNTKRESINHGEWLGYNANPSNSNVYNRMMSNNIYASYSEFENSEKNISSIKSDLKYIIHNPPKTGLWYKIEEDLYFCWTMEKSTSSVPPSSANPPASLPYPGFNTGGGGSNLFNQSYTLLPSTSSYTTQYNNSIYNQPSSTPANTTTITYNFILKSSEITPEYMNEFLDSSRKKLLNEIEKYEKEAYEKEKKKLENMDDNDFKGHIYEIMDKKEGKEGNTPIINPYEKVMVNTFCRSMKSLFFKKKDLLMNVLSNFKKKEGIYKKLPHRYKLGIMIYGNPGAGKSSLSVAIATELKRYIVRVSLKDKNLDDDKLSHILNNYKSGYVIILDELDTHKALKPRGQNMDTDDDNDNDDNSYEVTNYNFPESEFIQGPKIENMGKNIKEFSRKRKKLTLGCFLDAMDGISSTEDRVVIAMTNHPEHLDPAILRPGRFDIIINMNNLDTEQMILYFNYLLAEVKDITKEEIDCASNYAFENKVSTASLEQACIEKHSNPSKSLQECVKSVNESFKIC